MNIFRTKLHMAYLNMQKNTHILTNTNTPLLTCFTHHQHHVRVASVPPRQICLRFGAHSAEVRPVSCRPRHRKMPRQLHRAGNANVWTPSAWRHRSVLRGDCRQGGEHIRYNNQCKVSSQIHSKLSHVNNN